jgi:hypothetical protein
MVIVLHPLTFITPTNIIRCVDTVAEDIRETCYGGVSIIDETMVPEKLVCREVTARSFLSDEQGITSVR